MLLSEHLQKARDLITPPGTWTQEAYARNIEGVTVVSSGKRAVCFCAIGAISRTSPNIVSNLVGYLNAACPCNIFEYNDAPGRTQDEVLALFDKAIALAKSEGR